MPYLGRFITCPTCRRYMSVNLAPADKQPVGGPLVGQLTIHHRTAK
jgi:hypothetical protein